MDTFGLSTIGQIAITVTDVPRAVAFYKNTLGIKLLFEMPTMGFFDCGGVRLMLSPAEAPEADHPGSVIYFRVGDLQAAHAALEKCGATIVAEPHLIAPMQDHDLWMLFFKDTEDNLLALMSEVPRR